MNYKQTLNLPRTSFAMKANLTQLEPRILSRWQSLAIYRKLRAARKNAKKFILHDGPPYANGAIHMGHALNKILKDIVVKYKILSSEDCPFIIGWDCHGLPVEHQLFKELGLTKHDVEISDFRKKAKAYALKFVKLQGREFERLGIFSDWSKPYLTLDPEYEFKVLKLLETLTARGYIYRGRKPVNWCANCETALAEAEVEYLDKESESIYVRFAVLGPAKNLPSGAAFLIWTTTPWTLVSNVAVAVHPGFEYCLVELQGKPVVVGKDLLPLLEEKFGRKLSARQTFKGSALEGLELKHPFLGRKSKVVLADFVSCEEGSGCVHIAPGHGAEDFSLLKKYALEMIMPVDNRGFFIEPEEFRGKNITAVNQLVLKKLTAGGSLVQHRKITHSYPHCWRCKQPVIFRATFQWFLNVDHRHLRIKLLKQIERVNWFPASSKERMRSMLLTRPDWCISRQRLWGVPIPAVKCRDCGEVVLDKKVIALTAAVFRRAGSDSWFNRRVEEFIPAGFKCPSCGRRNFSKEFDILDVWFESGASFAAVVQNNQELTFPADLYLEGSDQHRGWFQVSLIPAVASEARAPFKAILTHGFVVDAEGKKMSKSLGNVISPQEIFQEYGVEILRLWAASADYSEDVKLSAEIIKQQVEIYRKVRNTLRFILGNISDFNPRRNKFSLSGLEEVDRFMLDRTAVFFEEVTAEYDKYYFYRASQKIFSFCNLDLSSFYLDILKDRLYTFSQNSAQRRSAQYVLYRILGILLKLIAPVLPFTAEEAYAAWDNWEDKAESVFVSAISRRHLKGWRDDSLSRQWKKILVLRDQVLKEIEKARTAGQIGSSLEAAVVLKFKGPDYKFYRSRQTILQEVLIVSSVEVKPAEFGVEIKKAGGRKCIRCWNWRSDLGNNKTHPDICGKCLEALKEAGA